MGRNLCLLTLNAQGLRDRSKRFRLYQWLRQQKFDIAYLQETHITDEIVSLIENETCDFVNCFHSCGTSKSRGFQFW